MGTSSSRVSAMTCDELASLADSVGQLDVGKVVRENQVEYGWFACFHSCPSQI